MKSYCVFLCLILAQYSLGQISRPGSCADLKFIQDNRDDYIVYEYIVRGRMKFEAAATPATAAVGLAAVKRVDSLKSEIAAVLAKQSALRSEINTYDNLFKDMDHDRQFLESMRTQMKRAEDSLVQTTYKLEQYAGELEKLNKYITELPDAEYRDLLRIARTHGTAPERSRLEAQIRSARTSIGEAKRSQEVLRRRIAYTQNSLLEKIQAVERLDEVRYPVRRGDARITGRGFNLAQKEATTLSARSAAMGRLVRVGTAIKWVTVAGVVAQVADFGIMGFEAMIESEMIDPPSFRAHADFKRVPIILSNPNSGYSFEERCRHLRAEPEISSFYRALATEVAEVKSKRESGQYALVSTSQPTEMRIFIQPSSLGGFSSPRVGR